MSAYIYFYVRKGDTFTCINCSCRSSAIYELFGHYIPYEKIIHIDSILDMIRSDCRDVIAKLERKKKEYKRKITAIAACNSPMAEKVDWIDEYTSLVEEVKEEIAAHKYVFIFCSFLEEILDCNEGDEKPILYAGIESGNEITLEDIKGE